MILTAASDVRFLFVSPEPSFHHVSEVLDQMRRLAVNAEFVDGSTAEHCGRLQTLAYGITARSRQFHICVGFGSGRMQHYGSGDDPQLVHRALGLQRATSATAVFHPR